MISEQPLRIGFLADFSGPLAEFGPAIQTGVELAIKHLNDAGGVLGQPVEIVVGDTALDPTQATEEARRLIEVEGVHAIVGPLASSITLAIVESVAADAGIPVISPSATSPQLTIAEDNDFLFRSTVSDAAQGPVLAQLAADQGYTNVGVLFLNDPYGQGLAEAFDAAWDGEANLVSIEPRQATYLAELQQAANNDTEALIVIAFPQEAEIFIREALEQGLFDEFLFVDGSKSQDLVDAIGGDYLNGMRGTAPAPGPESDSLRAFNEAYVAEFGELNPLPFIREAYDAAIAIGLATQAAGSIDPADIRDALREIAAPPGAAYPVGAQGIANALAALASGDSINIEGAATSLDWNENGDITSGYNWRLGLRGRSDCRDQRDHIRSRQLKPTKLDSGKRQPAGSAICVARRRSSLTSKGRSGMGAMAVHAERRPFGRSLAQLSLLVGFLALLAVPACSDDPMTTDQAQARQEQQQLQGDADSAAAAALPSGPLKLGFLLDFSGPLSDYGPELQRGFELAIQHINEAGGVWGMPVESAIGDTAVDPTIAVEEARRLIEIERVHGLVGPMSSAMALAVTESVSGPGRIPTISPVATSSQITLADDDDFLFRVSLTDGVQAQYLVRLVEQQGFDNVGLLYREDAFGQGMAAAFEEHWSGRLKSIGVDHRAASFTAELEQSVEFGPQVLVLIALPPETILILREALELGYYDQFVFGAAAKTPMVSDAIGAAPLAGMRGTVGAPAPASDSSEAWERAYLDEHGGPPGLPYVKEAYDATIALALAAQAAGSSDGGAIRDQLRRIGSAPGLIVIPQLESLAAGLKAVAAGEEINYEGAAGTIDWDEHGDSLHGYIGIWEFAEDGSIDDLEVFEFRAE